MASLSSMALTALFARPKSEVRAVRSWWFELEDCGWPTLASHCGRCQHMGHYMGLAAPPSRLGNALVSDSDDDHQHGLFGEPSQHVCLCVWFCGGMICLVRPGGHNFPGPVLVIASWCAQWGDGLRARAGPSNDCLGILKQRTCPQDCGWSVGGAF